jgi:protein-L-isoaspartate(D-aspartate) O-methyltransferase
MPTDFAVQRQIMVDTQVRPNDVPDLAIQDAMRTVPREACCPHDKAHLAYADAEVEYAPGRSLMRPRDVAKLLQTAHPKAGERALAIAAPYAAAVLEAMGLNVTRQDGDLKAKPKGAFDLIVCEGAVAEPPAAWLKALAVGGRLVVVVRSGPVGRLRLYSRAEEDIGWRDVFDSAAPMLAGFEPEARFVF